MTIPNREEEGLNLAPSPQDQKRILAELSEQSDLNKQLGDLYYVLSSKWFTSWQRYTERFVDGDDNMMSDHSPEEECPGPIDNSNLVSNVNDGDSPELIRELLEGPDYVLVPEEVWKKLFEWYKGGPPLPRKMISQGELYKQFMVEVYPLCLKLTDSENTSQQIIRLSRKATVRELYEVVCALKGLPEDKVCLWDYFNKRKQTELVISEMTLEDAHLQMDQHILLEVQDMGNLSPCSGGGSILNDMALVPFEPSRSSVTIAGGPSLSNGHSTSYTSTIYPGSKSSTTDADDRKDIGNASHNLRKRERGGLAGLQNLGNTCFMNSALQCLVHTEHLVEYFLEDYSEEINKQNPLGMRGELAIAFGELLRNMWSSGRTAIPPRVFKGKLARFAPQFSGYSQHDSQELLAFLLDGLHEDLNRVKQKPYIEMKDADGRPDEEYADECWMNHKARNDSIIVDTCQGQYKSTLVCPVCNKISIMFDPFMYLTLPLPSTVNRTMTVTVFYGDGKALPMPFTVTVPKLGNCRDLIQALGVACCLGNDESLLLAEVYDHKFYKLLDTPLEPLSSIKDDDRIVAYRSPAIRTGLKRLEIFHQSSERKFIGSPLLTFLAEESASVADVETAVKSVLAPFRKSHLSTSRINGKKQNGFVTEVTDAAENSLFDSNERDGFVSQSPFRLTVYEQRGSGGKKLEDDYVSNCSLLKVALHWSDEEHELYDINYLEDLPEVRKSGITAKKTRQEAVSLFSCLDAFTKEEPLGPDDMWYCPSCKEHRQASKKLDLWRLPEILVIHLKRFSYSRYFKNKLDTFINFPIHNLDLSKYVKSNSSDNSHVYELYAISNHYGGLGGGHYSAYAKLIDEDSWYHFDDCMVSPASESEIKTSAAYVLFYRRVKVESKSVTVESSEDHDIA